MLEKNALSTNVFALCNSLLLCKCNVDVQSGKKHLHCICNLGHPMFYHAFEATFGFHFIWKSISDLRLQ